MAMLAKYLDLENLGEGFSKKYSPKTLLKKRNGYVIKLFRHHVSADGLKILLDIDDVQWVCLDRQNKLEQLGSWLVASHFNKWGTLDLPQILDKSRPGMFECQEKWLDIFESRQAQFYETLCQLPSTTHKLIYEEITKLENKWELLAFLGFKDWPTYPIPQNWQKFKYPHGKLELFTEPDKIRDWYHQWLKRRIL